MQARAAEIEALRSAPAFWKNQEEASALSQELATLQEDINFIQSNTAQLREQQDLLHLATEEKDEALLVDITKNLRSIEQILKAKAAERQFSGPYDSNNVIVTIQAGAGGTDAQDWAAMLERMYVRFAESKHWKVSVLDRALGEEAGIKSSTFEIKAKYAYGLLSSEQGVHRLVRLSPYNADHLRQTSFARVEVIPQLVPEQLPDINAQDLAIDTFRASGAGGQHVNKTSSAVRIKHIPTNIVVTCQNQRSQAQNKAQALAVLKSKLQLLIDQQNVQKVEELRGEVKAAAWGNQIRSYVLHPYTQVKDHRSGMTVTDAAAVLEGDLSQFIGHT